MTTTYKTSFEEEYRPVLEKLYQEVLKRGYKPEKIDKGWIGPNGPTSVNDQVIHSRELIGFMYENWKDLQELLESHTSFKVVWSPDDRDPKTSFDATVRTKIEELNQKSLRDVRAQRSLIRGTAFRKAHAFRIFTNSLQDPFFFKNVPIQKIQVETFGTIARLTRPTAIPQKELSALEFLETKVGKCTEFAKAGMAIYTSSGYRVRPILVNLGSKSQWIDHVAFQVEIAPNHWIIVDLTLKKFDARYRDITPLTEAEFAGIHYLQGANHTSDPANWKRATFLYPRLETLSQAQTAFQNKEFEKGFKLLKFFFPRSDDVRPHLFLLQALKGSGEESKYAKHLQDLVKNYPLLFAKMATSISARLSLFPPQDSEPWLVVLLDLAKTPQEKKTAYFLKAQQLAMLQRADLLKLALDQALKEGVSESDYAHAFTLMIFGGSGPDERRDLAQVWYTRFPDSRRALEALLPLELRLENYDEVISLVDKLKNKKVLIPENRIVYLLALAKSGERQLAIQKIEKHLSHNLFRTRQDRRRAYGLLALLHFSLGKPENYHSLLVRHRFHLRSPVQEIFVILDFFAQGKITEGNQRFKLYIAEEKNLKALAEFIDFFNFMSSEMKERLTP